MKDFRDLGRLGNHKMNLFHLVKTEKTVQSLEKKVRIIICEAKNCESSVHTRKLFVSNSVLIKQGYILSWSQLDKAC